MKTTDIQNALTDVNDKYIAEAASYKRSTRSLKVWRAIAIAACCVIAVPLTALAAFTISDAVGSSSRKASSYGNSAYYATVPETYAETTVAAAWDNSYSSGSSGSSFAITEAKPESAVDFAEDAAEYEYLPSETVAGNAVTGNAVHEEDTSEGEKIIRTAYVNMQSTEYDNALNVIDSLTGECGGYYESKSLSDGSGSYRYASLSVRVPAENYSRFMEGLKDAGVITSQNENAEDVSDSYYDTKSRLETARTKLARLQELLAQAEDMSDIITIENAISDTEWEIDYYEGTLKGYDSRVSYSSVYIDLREVYKVDHNDTPVTFSERLSSAFQGGLDSFGEFLSDLVIWLAESWIWVLIIGAIIAGAIVVPIVCVKSARRRRSK